MQKLKDALARLAKGGPSVLDYASSAFSEAGSFADQEISRQKKELEEAGRVVDELALKYVEGYNPALKDNADFQQRANSELANKLDYAKKELFLSELNKESSRELLEATYELTQQRKAAIDSGTNLDEINRKIGLTENVLSAQLLREADGHRDVAKANAERAIASTQATITELENSKKRIDALLAELGVTDDLLASNVLANQYAASPQAFELATQQKNNKDAIDKAKFILAELQQARATFSAVHPAAKKAGKGSADRDELKDFLSEVEKQLSLLKKVSDEVEKVATRVVDSNRKLIRELADTGVIAFADSITKERELLKQQTDLASALSDNQLALVQTTEGLGEGVADATAKRKAAPRAKGQKGLDTRNRREDLIKLYTDEIDIENSLSEQTRKVEETRSEIIEREVKHRIAVHKQELASQEDAIKQAEETQAALESALNKVGLLNNSQLLQGQIERSDADLKRQREQLIRERFPLADPVTRDLLVTGLNELAKVVDGPLKDASEALSLRLQFAGSDRAKLDQFRQTVAESIRNEGLLEQLLERRLGLFKQIAEAEKAVNVARKAFEQLDTVAATTHARPDVTAAEAAQRALTLAQGRLTRASAAAQPGIDEVNQLLITLKAVGVTDEQIIEIEAKLNENRAKADRQHLADQVSLRDLRLTELDLQGRLVDFDLQRLDIQDQLLGKRAQLGIITDSQFKKQEAQLLVEREALLLAKQAVLEKQLATTTANLNLNGGATKNPALAQQQLAIQETLNGVGAALFDVKQKAYELTSPLLAAADAFKTVAEAVGNLPGPAAKLKGVFEGLESLAKTLGDKGRPNPEDQTLTAAQTFEKAGLQFQSAVLQFAAALQGKPISPGSTGVTSAGASGGGGIFSVGGMPISIDSSDPKIGQAKKEVLDKGKLLTANILRGVGAAAAGILQGISNKDWGSAIAGFGQLAELIPVAGPFIDAALNVIGGVVSFFTASAKKRTEAIAATIDAGIAQLKHSFSTGAIGLGEGLRQLQLKEEQAARQLSGRKGGADELKKITDNIEAEKQALRDQAKKIQDDFKANLDLLRSPKGLRDTITAINAIQDKAREFIRSFENTADAQAAMADAIDFIRLSIKELKDDIQKSLADTQAALRDAVDKFNTDSRNILLEGRVNPAVSEAESKRVRLVELEHNFQKQQSDLQAQAALEQAKLDYINSRNKLEEKLAREARSGADALSNAADKLSSAADKLTNAFNIIGRFPFGVGEGSIALTKLVATAQAPQAAPDAGTLTLNLKINGKDFGSHQVGLPVDKHLEISGRISPSTFNRYNPTLP